jgi:hypothetical protein
LQPPTNLKRLNIFLDHKSPTRMFKECVFLSSKKGASLNGIIVARAFDLEKYAFAAGINFAKESLG